MTAATIQTTTSEREFQHISFKGNASEYFKIWIVNILLSLLTLGIYSAWAKVRRISYFHNKTEIDGHAFTYHATGGKILIGRLIVVAILFAQNIIAQIYPIAGIAIAVLFVLFWPWAINKSLKFNARYTSWRNVRFDWHGDYTRTFIYTVLAPIGSVLSLGLLIPFFAKHYYRYYAENHSFGTKRFTGNPRTKDYYRAYFWMVMLPFPFVITIAYLFTNMALFGQLAGPDDLGIIPFIYVILIISVIVLPLLMIPFNTACRNLLLNSLDLDDTITFKSTLSPLKFFWIVMSNAVAIILSLGLMTAWAQVRKYRYLCNCTSHDMPAGMDEFVDREKEAMASFGEELADLNDMDISI